MWNRSADAAGGPLRPLARLRGLAGKIEAHERKAVALAFACNFMLLGSYYILRPLRDTMATVFGVAALQDLFTGTFVVIFLFSPLYAWAAARVKLSLLLPGVFWILVVNLAVFYGFFHLMPHNRWVAGIYFCWFSAINLILISVFWTLMADIFSAGQATRLYAFIAAGGSLGAIMGPVITTSFAQAAGIDGLLLMAITGFLLVIALMHLLMREKQAMRALVPDTQKTRLDHTLPGNPLRGFALVLRSAYMSGMAAFIMLMTWIATILYFLQADLVAHAYSLLEQRTIAFADVDLYVNICSAALLILGSGRLLRRFGVTIGLVLSPVLMVGACLAVLAAPSLFMVQAARALQRISQYALARPSREVLFTVIDQQSKYKAKNVVDTVVYRLGDLTAAWMQAGLRAGGFGLTGAVGLGVGLSAAWGIVGLALGRKYRTLRTVPRAGTFAAPAE